MVYRWVLALAFIVIVINSLKVSVEKGELKFYLVFLTHWNLICNAIAVVLGATIVTFWQFGRKTKYEVQINSKMSFMYRSFWFNHSVSVVMSIVVTINYWLLEYKGTEIFSDSWLKHGLNAILLMVDVLAWNKNISLCTSLHFHLSIFSIYLCILSTWRCK